MATNAVKEKTGAQWIFNDGTDYNPATGTELEQSGFTSVTMDMTSVGDGAARQSAKFDLGAQRASQFTLKAAVELVATPTTGERIDFYWNASPDSTAGDGNMGYTTGADAVYAGGVATLAEGLAQLQFIGSFIVSADAATTVQVGSVGTFSPEERYGSLVCVNEAGSAFDSDAIQIHFALQEVLPDIQAAA